MLFRKVADDYGADAVGSQIQRLVSARPDYLTMVEPKVLIPLRFEIDRFSSAVGYRSQAEPDVSHWIQSAAFVFEKAELVLNIGKDNPVVLSIQLLLIRMIRQLREAGWRTINECENTN